MVDVPDDVGRLRAPVVGGFVASITGGQPFLAIKGDFRAELELTCHRCGNPFAQDLDFEVDEALELVDEPPSTEEVGETAWSKGSLDVGDLVRQTLLLALPSQLLCGCSPLSAPGDASGDPRWQRLADFHPSSEEEP